MARRHRISNHPASHWRSRARLLLDRLEDRLQPGSMLLAGTDWSLSLGEPPGDTFLDLPGADRPLCVEQTPENVGMGVASGPDVTGDPVNQDHATGAPRGEDANVVDGLMPAWLATSPPTAR